MSTTKLFLLLQINDALFPIGAYTQSYGLETYVQKGLVTDKASLKLFLEQNIRYNLQYNDLLACKLAYQAAKAADLALIYKLDELLSVTKSPREIREASMKLGSRFLKNIQQITPKLASGIVAEYVQAIVDGNCKGHYALAYGIFCASQGLDFDLSLQHFIYAQLSSQINTAVKLIPLSQSAGQALLAELHPELSQILQQLKSLAITDLGRSAPGFDLRAMQHERLYSRLYMS